MRRACVTLGIIRRRVIVAGAGVATVVLRLGTANPLGVSPFQGADFSEKEKSRG